MKRVVLALVTLVACLGPLGSPRAADAQQPTSPRRIGVLLAGLSLQGKEAQEFRQGLRDAGYTEGQDILIEWRSSDDPEQQSEMVRDLVQRQVEVIVVTGTLAAQEAKRATSTIPIVLAFVGDPVGSGLVTSLAHPGGNVTGYSTMAAELSAKRLQLLKAVMPRLARVTVLWNPDTPWNRTAIEALKAAAPSLAIKLSFVGVQKSEEFDAVFAALGRGHTQALCLLGSPLFFSHQTALAKLAARARLPAVFEERKFAEEGGLMSYGASYADLFRRSAGYIDRILKGAKPSDLPIEQPIKFEFVVNLKTAKALGLTIPESILLRADEVIR
jgi:putative ABC transport system substrate-binding protein